MVKMNPTPKQKKLLDFMKEHIRATGISPSYEELRLMMGAKSVNSIFRMVHSLVGRGLISMVPGKPRSVVIL